MNLQTYGMACKRARPIGASNTKDSLRLAPNSERNPSSLPSKTSKQLEMVGNDGKQMRHFLY